MATGDQSDMYSRFKALLPRGWFGDESGTTIINAIAQGYAKTLSWMYQLYAYAVLQTRIKTMTGGWLDLAAYDFFGSNIVRKSGQSDSSFLTTIVINLFRERATRKSVRQVLYDLTGKYPTIICPENPNDVGAYGIPTSGYGVAGYYGSMLMPYQAFVIAYRATGTGVPNVAGYGIPQGAYSVGSYSDYAASSSLTSLTDADYQAAIESVKAFGTIVWMRVSN